MSMKSVEIYGKDTCPYTTAAREDYAARGYDVRYFNVKKDASRLTRMLALTDGRRAVPVIVEGGAVTVGFGGT